MKLQSSLLEPAADISRAQSKRRAPAWLRYLAGPLICFAVALAACALQNLHETSLQLARLFDAEWYLGTCEKIVRACSELGPHPSVAAVVAACQSMNHDIMTNGPVLPVIGSSVFLALHKIPTVLDMRTPVMIEAFLQALSAVLICLLSNRMTGSRKWGAATGICWALYPSAVIGSGIFLTETPTVLFLLSLIFALTNVVYSKRLWAPVFWGLLSGLFAALAALTKPALLPSIAIVCLLALIVRGPKRARIFFSSSLLMGAMIVMVPWLSYTKIATGQFYLTPQRMPTLNVVLGSNPETDGWGNLNQVDTPFVNLYTEHDSPLTTGIGIWHTNPQAFINLSLRKVVRLWGSPWNDYRTGFFGLQPMQQYWWHVFLLAAAVFGIMSFVTRSTSRYRVPYERFIGYSSIVLIAGHLMYLIFATTARYGFTAMPFMVLFAGYGFAYMWSNSCSRKVFVASIAVMIISSALLSSDLMPILSLIAADVTKLASLQFAVKFAVLAVSMGAAALLLASCQKPDRISLAGALSIILLLAGLSVVQYAFATDHHAIREWECPLDPGTSIKREVIVPPGITKLGKPDWALIVFDGNQGSGSSEISINGHPVNDKPVPLYLFDANIHQGAYYQQISYYQMFSGLMRKTPEGLRQWRAVQVPVEFLQTNGNNVITLTAQKPGTVIYGAYPPEKGHPRRTLSFLEFSTNRLFDGHTDELEPRVGEIMPLPVVRSLSSLNGSESDDLSPAVGNQFGEYRLYLALGYAKAETPVDQTSTAEPQIFTDAVDGPVPIDSVTGFGKVEHLPAQLFDMNHIQVTITGKLRSDGPQRLVKASVLLRGLAMSEGADLQLPAPQKQFTASPAGEPLFIQGELPTAALPKGEKALQILLFSGKKGVSVEQLHCEVHPRNSADFYNHVVEIL